MTVSAEQTASFMVALGPGAQRTIDDCVFEHRERLRHDWEVGGWLYTDPDLEHPNAREIIAASGFGNGRSGINEMRFDIDEAFRVEDKLLALYQTSKPMLCGNWHCHPGHPNPEPSSKDQRSWLNLYDTLTRHGYRNRLVGLILVPEPPGTWRTKWLCPDVHAWTVHRQPHDQQPICEPAHFVRYTR